MVQDPLQPRQPMLNTTREAILVAVQNTKSNYLKQVVTILLMTESSRRSTAYLEIIITIPQMSHQRGRGRTRIKTSGTRDRRSRTPQLKVLISRLTFLSMIHLDF